MSMENPSPPVQDDVIAEAAQHGGRVLVTVEESVEVRTPGQLRAG